MNPLSGIMGRMLGNPGAFQGPQVGLGGATDLLRPAVQQAQAFQQPIQGPGVGPYGWGQSTLTPMEQGGNLRRRMMGR